MTFPTKADIEFFKEAKGIQELWEPKYGDWVYLPRSEQIRIVTVLDRMGEVRLVEVGSHWLETKVLIFLPRPDQLWEMLEERGWRWRVQGHAKEYSAVVGKEPDKEAFLRYPLLHKGAVGPTPSIALGKCLLEVLKE